MDSTGQWMQLWRAVRRCVKELVNAVAELRHNIIVTSEAWEKKNKLKK